MSTTEELLQQIVQTSVSNILDDSHIECTINPETRKITLSQSIIGVENDKRAERIYFTCPRYVGDSIDLSTYSLRINYKNANGTKSQYAVTDLTIDGDNVKFTWELYHNVTVKAGEVSFIVCAVKMGTVQTSQIDYEFNTIPCKAVVLEGLEVDSITPESPQYDILAQLINQMATKIGDAPSDNKEYTRKNAAWVESTNSNTTWGNITGNISSQTDLQTVLNGKYVKPATGIPKTDLNASVQASLGLADTALQSHQSLSAYRTSEAQDVIDATKANTSDIPTKVSDLTNDSGFITGVEWDDVTDKPTEFTPSTHTHTKSQITDFPTLSTVATSGKYTDLTDKPSIPDSTSDLTNDSGFLTSHQSLSAYRASSAQDAIDATLQPKNDSNLNTTSKSVVGAINEVNTKVLPTASDDGDSVVYDDGKWIRTRGFGYYVPTESTLLNTTTMDKDDFIQDEDLYMYVFNFSQSYLSGDTYKVTFDGDEYECVAKSQTGSIMFGNFSILDEEEEDTGEPFLFSSNSQYNQCGFIIDYEPTEDIDVKIVGNTYTPHKFDVDLLPHFIEFPSGGDNGEVLTYHTNGVSWDTLIGLPSGGLQGQYLIKTENGFGWEMPEIPEKTSDLTNDSGFIDNEVNDLEYYYKKTQTYSKAEANEIISEANQAITQYCQPKNDNTLSTTAKTVVGAINELSSGKQDSNSLALSTTAKTIVGAINEHESDISSLNTYKQDKHDNTLTTTSKTVVGAINEHESDISQINQNLATKISRPSGGSVGQILTKTLIGEAWSSVYSELPEAEDDGTGVVYDGSEWIATDGYGYYYFETEDFYNDALFFNEFEEINGLYIHTYNSKFSFVSGSDYSIWFNGTEYDCTAATRSNVIYVGNLSLIDDEEEDTDEPFVFSVFTDNRTTISTNIVHEEVEEEDVDEEEEDEDYFVEYEITENVKHSHKFDSALIPTTSVNWTSILNKPQTFTPSTHTHVVNDITDFPTLSTVATSGSYNDLSNKPSIPSKTSELQNDSGYLTSHQSLSAYRTATAQDVIDLTKASASDVSTIQSKIPNEASSSNQLADKSFVNSSVSTNTANYISNNGEPFISLAQLQAYSGTITNNDYAFVTGIDENGNTFFDRYKATVSSTVSWAKEYRLNNSSFTQTQWSAINSGITSSKVSTYDGYATAIAGKQNTISDLNTIRSNASSGASKVSCTDATVGGFGYTKNTGTVTSVAVKMNGSTKGTVTSSGTIDLGTVITSHQSLSSYRTASDQDTIDNAKVKYEDLNGRDDVPDEETLTHITDYDGGVKYHVPQGTYSKPANGIPKTDLTSTVQTSLSKADTALQSSDISGLQPKSDNSLSTTTKTVVGAINEHESDINTINTTLTNKISASDIATEPSDYIRAIKIYGTNIEIRAKADSDDNVIVDTYATKTELSNKASASDVTAHTGNSNIHTTLSEKSTWNGKQNALSTSQISSASDPYDTYEYRKLVI